MPVGTLGTVKSMTPEELSGCGVQIILGNTYHLYLRPGCDVIDASQGLHRFMNWNRPILTDSGGFQVFSLAALSKITEQGVTFQSHIDGSKHILTPEKAIEIQLCLGSDIMMCLDNCISYPATEEEAKKALEQTARWGERCKTVWDEKAENESWLFGIVQGGMFRDLRRQSVEHTVNTDFSGYAVGGLSVGEPREVMHEVAGYTIPMLPDSRPRYVMGVGTPEDLVEMVSFGADMFDCVMPTRNARNGQLFTEKGKLNICNSRFKKDSNPLEANCSCYTCQHYSRSYLRHLYMTKELLAYRLNTIHNIYYYISLMENIRKAIKKDCFDLFMQDFYTKRET